MGIDTTMDKEQGRSKWIQDSQKEQVEKEVKETFKNEEIPVEPVLGNDGEEVGGEG